MYIDFDQTELQQMLTVRDEEKKETAPSWSIMGFVKKIVGILIFFSLMKTLLFPQQKAAEVNDEEFRNFHLNETEQRQLYYFKDN